MLRMLLGAMMLPFYLAVDNVSEYVSYRHDACYSPLWFWRMSDATIQAIAAAVTAVCGVLAYMFGHRRGTSTANGRAPEPPCPCQGDK